MTRHTGIVGGGLMGRLLAWRLACQGDRVTVIDAHAPNACAGAAPVAAAMLAPWSEAARSERIVFDQGLAGIAVWRQWLDELSAETGLSVACCEGGSLVVAHAADRNELQKFRQELCQRLGARVDAVTHWDRARLERQEPELATRFNEALHLPDEASLDNTALLQALALALKNRGVAWRVDRIQGLERNEAQGETERYRFDALIDARGFGARADWSSLRGVRGEVLWLQADEVTLSRPVRLMHPRYQLYIVPRPQQRFVIGATEIESDSEAPVTVRSSLELLSALYTVHSGFAEAVIEQAHARCRPALPDNLPAIRRTQGSLMVNGLYRHGYLLAPSVVLQVLAVLKGASEAGPWPSCVQTEERCG